MHSILTRAKFTRFSGTSVPRDFVEAPSQMLENWVWDKKVLDSFAADYRDPSKKIPDDILAQLKAARLATEGTRYRRQLSLRPDRPGPALRRSTRSNADDDPAVVQHASSATSSCRWPPTPRSSPTSAI